MKKKSIRDTPVIVIPKGYTIDEMLDFDDEGYENGEPVAVDRKSTRLNSSHRT